MSSSIITISCQYGSGGRIVSAALSQRLGIPLYDKSLFEEAASKSGLNAEFLEHSESMTGRRLTHMFQCGCTMPNLSLDDMAFLSIESTILDIAAREPCIIVGCGANKILADRKDVLSVYVYADRNTRLKRIIDSYGVPADKAERVLADTDRLRIRYLKDYTNQAIGMAENYHMCLDSGKLGIEAAIRMIKSAYLSL